MRPFPFRGVMLLGGLMPLLGSCAYMQQFRPLAWMTVDGPNATLNGQPVQGDSIAIRNNDHVVTGTDTSVRIQLVSPPGTFVQLDQNTDPDIFAEADCLWVRMLKGKLFSQGTGLCVESPDLAAALNSEVSLSALPTNKLAGATESVLTVIEGHAEVTRPMRTSVGTFQQVIAGAGKILEPPRAVSSSDIANIIAWRNSHPRLLRLVPGPPAYVPPAQESPANSSTPAQQPPPATTPSGVPANRLNPVVTTRLTYCCLPDHQTPAMSPAQCSAQKGRSFPTYKQALDACAVVIQ